MNAQIYGSYNYGDSLMNTLRSPSAHSMNIFILFTPNDELKYFIIFGWLSDDII